MLVLVHHCSGELNFIVKLRKQSVVFSAPEVMQDVRGSRRMYGPKADVWSLGAILYAMTYGQPPKYTSRAAEPPSGQAASRDRSLIDILRRMLVLDPRSRADINSVQRHQYTRH